MMRKILDCLIPKYSKVYMVTVVSQSQCPIPVAPLCPVLSPVVPGSGGEDEAANQGGTDADPCD